MKTPWVLIGLFAGLTAMAADPPSIYHDGWIDLNKDGRKEIYEDPSQPIKQRVNDLMKRMTLEEKIGQLGSRTRKRILTWPCVGKSVAATSARF